MRKETRVSGNPDPQIAKPNSNSFSDQESPDKLLLRSQNVIFFEENSSKYRCVFNGDSGLGNRLWNIPTDTGRC